MSVLFKDFVKVRSLSYKCTFGAQSAVVLQVGLITLGDVVLCFVVVYCTVLTISFV